MRTKLTFALLTLAGLAFLASFFGGSTSRAAALLDDSVNSHWKGASQLTPVSVAPNPTRCGPFPENIEITFSGSGIDTGGGIFSSAASTCTNTTTGLIFDLKSTDTYVTGDAVFIETDPFTPVLDPATCVSTNTQAVKFRVAGGTGVYSGATGQGRFHLASNEPTCNGIAAPARVSFEGVLKLAH
ncbi:MAG TPA: hypothetical protein VJP89_20340 [Pyrinomonadaceae bacterium]|nr:hypothetical protein [Pyrinomonadaceae bacterium]